MTDIPMPQGYRGIKALPKLREHLVNLYWTEDGILRTPGIEAEGVFPEEKTRGSTTWYVDNQAYFVVGTRLYVVDSSLAKTDLGEILGNSDCVFSLGQVNLVIVVKDGAGYRYNATEGLVQITDADYVKSNSVDFINGRHVFVPTDGSPAFYSEVDNAGNISPLNFFDAEELPDLNKVTINISNQLFIGGGESFETYRGDADVTSPFVRREGSRVDVGYVSGIVRFSNTFAFIGRQREQSYAIHIMGSGNAPMISNPAVTELLNTEYTPTELESVHVEHIKWKGNEILIWTLPRHSIAFVNGNWTFFDSNLNGLIIGPWRAKGITFAYGEYYCGDETTNKLGRLSDIGDEYSEPIEWELKTFARSSRASYFGVQSLELDVLTGQNDTTAGLALSRDGLGFGDFHYVDLGPTGEYQRRVQWSGGLGNYENFMGIKCRGTGNVQLSLESIQVNFT